MKILLSNDDGYRSPGIRVLKRELLACGHDVYLCAPLRQRSASGHSITLFKKMELVRLDEKSYALDGSPADTVKVSTFGLFGEGIQFDLVISGINCGPNMGEDIFYSGTVAAAREGVINGFFSIACSADTWDKQDEDYYEPRAKVICALVNSLTPELLSRKRLLNINFPHKMPFQGVKVATLGDRIYRDDISIEEADGKTYVTLGGETPAYDSQKGSDLDYVNEGYISLTPLEHKLFDDCDFTDEFLKKIKNLEGLQVS